MQLILNTPGLLLKKKLNCFLVVHGKNQRLISPNRIKGIWITGDALCSTSAYLLAAQFQIPIIITDKAGNPAVAINIPMLPQHPSVRRALASFKFRPAGWQWCLAIISLKLERQIENLLYWQTAQNLAPRKNALAIRKALHELPKEPRGAQDLAHLRGVEGGCAQLYWKSVAQLVPTSWAFANRSRQPATDSYNCVLNYAYGMLQGTIRQSATIAGLDISMGIFHADGYQRAALVFDLMEPFRPWVDHWLFQFIREHRSPLKTWFNVNQKGVYLNKAGKQIIIPHFKHWLATVNQFYDKKDTPRNCMAKQSFLLVEKLKKEPYDFNNL